MPACPTCGLPLVRLPAVVVSGPPLPDVAECERGHQVEVLAVAAPDPVRPALGPDGRLIGWDWPIVPPGVTLVADYTGEPLPWSRPDADPAGDMRRWFAHVADRWRPRPDDYPPTGQ